MIISSIKTCIEQAEQKKWNRVYWAFDLHGTVLIPNYTAGNIPTEFYPNAKETLQMISKMPEICLIMYTCSHPHEIEEYLQFFKKNEINFQYVNRNPEVQNGTYGYYADKFYFNVLFEDKAGFVTSEWIDVRNFILKNYDFVKHVWEKEEGSHDNFFGYNIRRVMKFFKNEKKKLIAKA